jgi:hypothetical protein
MSCPTLSEILGYTYTLSDTQLETKSYSTSFYDLKKISCLPNDGEGWTGSENYTSWVNTLFTNAKSSSEITETQNLYFCKVETSGSLRLTKLEKENCSSSNCFMTTDPDGCTKVMSGSAAPEPWNRIQLNGPTTLSQTDTNPAAIYSYNNAFLRKLINDEFCYYKICYTHALKWYLTNLLNRNSNINESELLLGCKKLNRKLNQILGIMKELQNKRGDSINSYYTNPATGVNQLNRNITVTKTRLSNDVELLKKAQDETYIKNAIMEYTIEKNNSSRNLLAIYGFLNIVAIGILYTLYKRAKN